MVRIIKFGLALPYNQASHIPRWAQLAEAHGWDGCFLGDAVWGQDPMVILAAAAMTTRRIRLGPLVIPTPLRTPWKIASEAVALDHLSNGRLTLGLGAGAAWMGWHAFPDAVTETKGRVAMLDETIDILTLLFQRKPFDYAGAHYHVALTQLDVMHYPPKPVQQPRVPLWAPAIWPFAKSMRRALKCDGLLAEARDSGGAPRPVTPEDVRAMRDFVTRHHPDPAAFDIVVMGQTGDLDAAARSAHVQAFADAGATWWVEELWGADGDAVAARIEMGPAAGRPPTTTTTPPPSAAR